MANHYASVTATQVGSYFVQQYYQVLQQQRDYVHQFYSESSSMLRVDGDVIHSASDMMKIHQLIMSMNFTGIEIKTINSLESLRGGVLVVVSGSVKSRDFNGWRKFVQTFVLAPQEKGYFVLNDVFHFVDPELVHQPSVLRAREQNVDYHQTVATSLSDPPVSSYTLEDEAVNYVRSVHIEDREPVQEYGYIERHHHQHEQESEPEPEAELETYEPEEETTYEESSWHEPAINVQEPQPATEEPAEEPEKLSYASILRARGKSSAPSISQSAAFTWGMPPAAEKNHVTDPLVQQQQASFPPSSSNGAVEESFSLDEGKGEFNSVYVRNLSPMATAHDIAEEFKSFGKIKSDGVFLKNRKDTGICYAFVEFEDSQSVQNAIQASPIQFGGRQVYIEERRPNSAAAAFGGRRGGRGRGRGGRYFGRGSDQSTPLRSNGFRGGH